jgi:hypothetical protein
VFETMSKALKLRFGEFRHFEILTFEQLEYI